MPLVRSNDVETLKLKFIAFNEHLFECIRRDNADMTSRYFTGGSSNFIQFVLNAEYNQHDELERYFRGEGAPEAIAKMRLRQYYGDSAPVGIKNTKETILCAFDLTNNYTGSSRTTNRINKQQLYAFLFVMGLPMGLIAKIILNGELGAVRNGILKHKEFCQIMISNFARGNRLSNLQKGFFGTEAIGTTRKKRIWFFAQTAYKVGGMNLLRKFIVQSDQQAYLTESEQYLMYNVEDGSRNNILTKNILCGENESDYNFCQKVLKIYNYTFSSERGVRRTGQTLSRNALRSGVVELNRIDTLPTTQTTLPNTEVRNSVSTEQRRSISTPSNRRMVRDEPLQETIGLEIEVARPKDMSQSEFRNTIIKNFREAGLDVEAEGYNHQTRSYWKLVPDGSIADENGRTGSYPNEMGIEAVSPIYQGAKGIVQMRKAIRALRASGGSVNQSVGVHVHFGIGGMDLQHLKYLLYNYRGFEKLIDDIMIPTRRRRMTESENNTYLSRQRGRATESQWASSLLNKFPNDEQFWQILDRCTSISDISNSLFGGEGQIYRYWKTNLQSYSRYGTIEFRQLQGSLEEDTIIYWIYWLHFLIQASKRKKLTFFDYKQVRNITPVWLSTWIGNRAFDMAGRNFNSI